MTEFRQKTEAVVHVLTDSNNISSAVFVARIDACANFGVDMIEQDGAASYLY
jgi:hypothetical protein